MNLYKQEYPGIYKGEVLSNDDPLNIGRCKIRIPSIHAKNPPSPEVLPWAKPVSRNSVSASRGSYDIPDVGDIVWVMFEGANKNYPIYLGGIYSINDIPVKKDKVVIYTEEGDSIVYDRNTRTYSINTGSVGIAINKEGVSIEGSTSVKGNLSIDGELYVSGDLHISSDLQLGGAAICDDLQVTGSSWIPGGSLDLSSMEAMSEEEFNNIEFSGGDWMSCVTTIKQAMASKGVTYNQSGSTVLEVGGNTMTVRTDCSGLVSAMVSLYLGKHILMNSYGYVSASNLEGFQRVSTSDLKAGDICARNGHVEVYAYRSNGKDYVYSGGSTKSLNSPGPTAKGSGSYDTVWRPI